MSAANIPSHVPKERVFEFDIYGDHWLKGDVYESLQILHRDAPDIFFTPANGGHWVVTRFDHIEDVMQHPERFSSRHARVPRLQDELQMIPINLDPPAHTLYRKMLNPHFGPAQVKTMEQRIRGWAHCLIAPVVSQGECDFVEEFASVYPVSIFMELMGLPLERLPRYRALVVEYFGNIPDECRLELEDSFVEEMREVLDARLEQPRDDLASKLLASEIDGRKLNDDELKRICNLLFQAGMDTVTNFMGLFFQFLARRPDLQRVGREDPGKIPAMVEEGFRRFGVVSPARLVAQDTYIGDVAVHAGDMLICVLPLAGLDERRNPEPEHFEIDRRGRSHMLFSQGPHLCLGHNLARSEVRIFLQEWFRLMPEFQLAEGFVSHVRPSQVLGLESLPIRWEVH